MQKLFTNTEVHEKDRLCSFINREAVRSKNLDIATAYFKHNGLANDSLFGNTNVRLLIGLNEITQIQFVRSLLGKDNFTIKRYFDHFHPKMYIFSTGIAVIGSSNYTVPGIGVKDKSNRECNVATDDIHIFRDASKYFNELWDAAPLLTENDLDEMEMAQKRISESKKKVRAVLEELRPKLDFDQYTTEKDLKEAADYDKFRRDFAELSDQYTNEVGRLSNLPIRIEIDKFLYWLKEQHVEDPMGPIYDKRERAKIISSYLVKFRQDPIKEKYFDEGEKNPLYNEKLLTIEAIRSMDEESARKIVRAIHSFENRAIDSFIKENGVDKIQRSFEYFIFGKDDIKVRITKFLKGEYELKYFKQARALEMLGWASEDYPMWNFTVAMGMSLLGFNKFHRSKTTGANDRPTNKK